MKRDYMGLNSKDAVFKKEALEGCKEPDGFESFNNQQECEFESPHLLQLHHATKPTVPMMMNNPFFRPIFSGVPLYQQSPVLPWCVGSKVASVAAQLTIFYDGMVNVYDGISPEKAQAIMFLAGNEHFAAVADVPQPSTQPCSPVSSPMSVTSHHVGPLAGGPSDETEAAKRIMSALQQATQSAIPQARKASLARFLEKRKERVMASAPYSLCKNIMDCASDSNSIVAGECRELSNNGGMCRSDWVML